MSFNCVTMKYSGMSMSACGIRYATSTAVLSGLVPRHFKRTSAYAPRLAANTDTSVLTHATRIVLAYQVANGSWVNRNVKCSSVHGDGQNMLWICWIWSVLLNAVTKM